MHGYHGVVEMSHRHRASPSPSSWCCVVAGSLGRVAPVADLDARLAAQALVALEKRVAVAVKAVGELLQALPELRVAKPRVKRG